MAGLLMVGQLVVETYLAHLARSNHSIILAERQRMRGLRVVKVVLLLPRHPELASKLESDFSRLTIFHRGGTDPEAPDLAAELREMPWPELVECARQVAQGDRSQTEQLLLLDSRLQASLATLVARYELRHEELSQRLLYLGLSIRLLTLGAVLLMFALLFRPVQRELARVDSELAQVLENSAELIGHLDRQGRLGYVNRSWERSLGFPAAQLRGRTLEGLLAPDSRAVWQQALASGSQALELVLLTRDSKRVQVEGVVNWSDQAASCYFRDVTQTRRLQETFDRFFHMAHDMLCITDRQGRFLKLNPAWERAAGYPPGEQLGHSFLEYIHPDDLAASTDRATRLAAGEELGAYESRARRADGSYRWLLWSSAFDPREQVFYSTARDVTERRELEEQVLAAKQQAEQASRAKSAFLANMGHELRTPLNSILGFSELLAQESFGPLNPRQARQVSSIMTSGQHLLGLIEDILDQARIEAGRLSLSLQPVLVRSALEQQIASMDPQAQERGLRVEVEDWGPEGLQVLADPARLRQIVLNLLGNAIKFTPSGGLVKVGVRASEQEVTVWIQDNGIGVSPADHERIFERFEQVDTTFGRRQQGTGLGLALTRQLVELQGGRISVESQGVEGEGSRFQFTLPRVGGSLDG